MIQYLKNIGLIIITVTILQVTRSLFCSNHSLCFVNDKIVFGQYGTNALGVALLFFSVLVLLVFFSKYWIAFILVGAILSNTLERIFYSGVVDYISVSNFPVFNLGDIVLVVTIFSLVLQLYSGQQKQAV